MRRIGTKLLSPHPMSRMHHLLFIHDMLCFTSAFLWIIAYVSLYMNLRREKSAAGISLQSLLAFCFVELSEVLLLFTNSKYVGFSLSYCISVCSSAIISFTAFIHIYRKFVSTYDFKQDSFGRRFSSLIFPSFLKRYHWLFLYLIAAALSIPCTFYRRANIPFALSFLECFNDSVIAVALLPQLFMFYGSHHRIVKGLQGQDIFFFILNYTLFLFPFFYSAFPAGRGIHAFTDLLNVLILSDFSYFYIKAKLQRKR
ncbi:hypothetical protein IE077_004047, partial [Cardiosporidium cionae]